MRKSAMLDAITWRRALGELALIVFGVMIALWADGCVARVGEREEEHARLRALQENVDVLLVTVREERANAAGAAEAIRQLLGPDVINEDRQDLNELLRYALLYGADFSPALSVYEDLKSAGELSTLTDAKVRRALALMDASLVRVRSRQADMLTVQQLNIDPYMVEHVDLVSLYAPIMDVGHAAVPESVTYDFIEDTRFRSLLLLKLDQVSEFQDVARIADERLGEVSIRISAQLGR